MTNLISISDFSVEQIEGILARAGELLEVNRRKDKSQNLLHGQTVINLFIENSTRTLTSFELAAKRLGADVITMNVEKSSITVKGESLVDTAMTLNAMHPDFIVVRHNVSGQVKELAEYMDCAVINAGDGTNEHPTQALLDAAVIMQAKGKIAGLNVTICGDILHSRVAHSNMKLLTILGANVRVGGPKELMPSDAELADAGVTPFASIEEGVAGADIVMTLRLQKERMATTEIPNEAEFFKHWGVTAERMAAANDGAMVMDPGPVRREISIASELVDDAARSLVLKQVEMGIPMRQAILEHLGK